jgi:hypothetical protein
VSIYTIFFLRCSWPVRFRRAVLIEGLGNVLGKNIHETRKEEKAEKGKIRHYTGKERP